MKKAAAYFKNRINLWLLPLLLSTAVGKVMIDCYAMQYSFGLTIVYFLYTLVLFVLFDAFSKRRIIGGIGYMGLLAFALFIAFRLVYTAWATGAASMNFEQWFYASFETEQAMQIYYVSALFIAGGFFMISVLYYFTQIRYRAFGTLLAVFTPFVIYAKRDDTMSDLTVTMLITLYIAVMVHNKLFLQSDHGRGTKVNTAYVLSVALFVSVAGAMAMIFPDLSTQSRLEKDASFLNFGNGLNSGDGLLNPDHSTKFHGAEYTGKPILYVYPGENFSGTVYLRRRSMNAYEPSSGEWYTSRDLRSEDGLWDISGVNFMSLYGNMELDADRLTIGKKAFDGNNYTNEETDYMDFEVEFADDTGSVDFIPVPLYGVPTIENEDIAYNPYTRLRYNDMYAIPASTPQQLGRVSISVPKFDDYMKDFAQKAGGIYADFKYDTTSVLADVEAALEKGEDEPEYSPFEEYLMQTYNDYYRFVSDYYNWKPDYLEEYGLKDYDRIKALADEIVKDCKTDYEKIKAIEGYFTKEGFVYDLDYIPDDESVSYFLFESKTGVCIDYATAMTVMLGMEGIPCRYVEGYVADERDDEDPSRIVVRDYNAHAFVEAFVPYVGWMRFEPTVAGFMDIKITADEESGVFTVVLQYLGRVLIVLGVLFVTVFILLFDRIWERCFRIRLHFMTPERKLIHLYGHIVALLQYEDKTDLSAYTVDMLSAYIAKKTGQSLDDVTKLFEVNRFGRGEVSEESFEKAYASYKALYPMLRKKKQTVTG